MVGPAGGRDAAAARASGSGSSRRPRAARAPCLVRELDRTTRSRSSTRPASTTSGSWRTPTTSGTSPRGARSGRVARHRPPRRRRAATDRVSRRGGRGASTSVRFGRVGRLPRRRDLRPPRRRASVEGPRRRGRAGRARAQRGRFSTALPALRRSRSRGGRPIGAPCRRGLDGRRGRPSIGAARRSRLGRIPRREGLVQDRRVLGRVPSRLEAIVHRAHALARRGAPIRPCRRARARCARRPSCPRRAALAHGSRALVPAGEREPPISAELVELPAEVANPARTLPW